MRLSRWQIAGIVLSLTWAVGAAIYQRNLDVERAQHQMNWAHQVCVDTKYPKQDKDVSDCSRESEKHREVFLEGRWGNVAFTALAPIPFGLLAAFILINVGRAQVIGFRAVVPWATLNLPKKAFVVFCGLASGGAVLFGILFIFNRYVDAQVPVTLGYRAMVINVGNDLVSATGTWTREGVTGGSKMGFPLQTSSITCYRQERRCFEARAIIMNSLNAELLEYMIESWSDTTIVYHDDQMCGTTVFTIDRKTETVNGLGRLANMDTDYCKRYAKYAKPATLGETTWSYHLSDGFKVYWEQRQKARPLPLRLIQTLFGN